MCKPEEIESEVVEHMKSLEPVHQCLATIYLETQKIAPAQSSITVSNLNGVPNSTMYDTSHYVQCKLPKMQMPDFNGDQLKWQGFWDRYEVYIHSNANIREIDKFNYLQGGLKGEALDAISGLTLSMENYKEAIQLLKNRFGNEQLLISAHMESLIKISKIRG